MDRREFLKATSGAAAVAASATAAVASEAQEQPVTAPALASGRKVLRLAMPWADDGKGMGDTARRLARRIEALSDGRFHIEIGPDTESEADLRHGTPAARMGVHPAFAYFAGLPGEAGLTAEDLEAWLAVGGGQHLWDDLAADAGMKPLLAGHTAAPSALWSRVALRGIEDLAGARLFAVGLGADVARALGAEPVAMPLHRLKDALSDGTLGLVDWGGPIQSLALGLHTTARFATGSGLNARGIALELAVRLPVWESFTQSEKGVLAAAAAEEFRTCLAESRAHASVIRDAMASVHGVGFTPFPADLADALSRVADATVAHTAGYDARAARIDRSYMAFKGAVAEPGARQVATS